MNTLDYMVDCLARTLVLITNNARITTTMTKAGVRLAATFSVSGKSISANNIVLGVGYKFDKNAKHKERLGVIVPWEMLESYERTDKTLKYTLEYFCHLYTNDVHTQYYDPNLAGEIEPTRPLPASTIQSTISVGPLPKKSVIANRILQQIEDDAAWDPTSLIAEIRGNKHA
jgi:hypothetical protein